MTVNLSLFAGAGAQFFDENGSPLVGGSLYTYLAGSTTAGTTYTSNLGTIAHTNPIILDSAGRVPSGGEIWLTQAVNYKFVLYTADNVLVGTYDNISPANDASAFLSDFSSTTNNAKGDALIGFRQSNNAGFLAGAVGKTVNAKLQEYVSIKDFGAVGDGVTDDTASINAALAAANYIYVPTGAYLISSTITLNTGQAIKFQSSVNIGVENPNAYFIKKSSMTSAGIVVGARAWIDGGALICQVGNTGDGVQMLGNSSKLTNFGVRQAGGVGVRVGPLTTGNCNNVELNRVGVYGCGSHGFYVHQGSTNTPSNGNMCMLYCCRSGANGGDGFRIGHTWWTQLINCLADTCTGYGLYVSGDLSVTTGNYPQARWTMVIGGNYLEGNTAGIIFDQGYFSTFLLNQSAQAPTTARGPYQGSGRRLTLCTQGSTVIEGATIDAIQYPLIVDNGTLGGATFTYPFTVKKAFTGSAFNGVGYRVQMNNTAGTAGYVDAYAMTTYLRTTNMYNTDFDGIRSGVVEKGTTLDCYLRSWRPYTDNTWALGLASTRWTVVYATTGTINTSDGNQKQQVKELTTKEKAVAKRLKKLIRTFKWNDAVEAKGDQARIHVGVIAQDVKAAFKAEGLDANKYAMFCENTEDGKTTMGVRYDQLLAFIIGAL